MKACLFSKCADGCVGHDAVTSPRLVRGITTCAPSDAGRFDPRDDGVPLSAGAPDALFPQEGKLREWEANLGHLRPQHSHGGSK